MSNRTVAEQICAVLVLDLKISKKEAGRFLEFYGMRSHRFDFKDGVLAGNETERGGWFLRGHAVGADPILRTKHKELLTKVNNQIWAILVDALPKQEEVGEVTQVA